MRFWKSVGLLVWAVGLAGAATTTAAAAPDLPSPLAFVRNPDLRDADLSPSGRWSVGGKRMRDAMNRAGLKPEYIVYDGEGHGWAKVENRVDFWNRVDRFLAQELR